MKRLFIDLTGVVLDIEPGETDIDYSKVKTLPGAMEAIQEIIDIECCEVWLVPDLKTPTIMNYINLLDWVKNNFPSLVKYYTLSGTMDHFASKGDMLIANQECEFIGNVVDFSKDNHNWKYITDIIESAIKLEIP